LFSRASTAFCGGMRIFCSSPVVTGEGNREAVEGACMRLPPPPRCARHLPRKRGRINQAGITTALEYRRPGCPISAAAHR
jgi:hypothetical protein